MARKERRGRPSLRRTGPSDATGRQRYSITVAELCICVLKV